MSDSLMKPTTPEKKEIAAAGGRNDITQGWVSSSSLLPYQDSLLNTAQHFSLSNKGGHDLRLFEAVLEDDQVFSCLQQRTRAVVSADWTVSPGGETDIDLAAAEFIRGQVSAVAFDDVTEKMLAGRFYGFSFAEMIWGRDDSAVVIDEIKVRNRRRFRFTADGEPRLLTMDDQHSGRELPDRKFWHFSTGGDNSDNPYGRGLAGQLYWPVFFKKHGIQYWMKFLEKFGRPTARGSYPPGATQEQKDALLGIALAVGEYDAVTMPEGQMVDLIEASRGGTVSYESLVQMMNKAISKVILSQTMTTDDGSSQSQATVHQGVARSIAKSDADLICSTFNRGPVRWLTEWNFPGAVPPRVWRDMSPPTDLGSTAERDNVLYGMGFVPSLEYIKETYGDGFDLPETGQEEGLNGAQLQAIAQIIELVSAGTVGVPAGRQMVRLAVPKLTDEQAATLVAEPVEPTAPLTEPPPSTESPAEGGESLISSPAFSATVESDTVSDYTKQLADSAAPIVDGWVSELRTELNNAESLTEFSERIAQVYPELPSSGLREILFNALTAASIAGGQEDLSEAGKDGDLPEIFE